MSSIRSELRWWGRAFRLTWRRGKGWVIAFAVVTLLLGWVDWIAVVLGGIAAAWALRNLRRRFGRGGSLEQAETRLAQQRYVKDLARLWPVLMARVGCGVVLANGARDLPRLANHRWADGGSTLHLSVSHPLGMTVEQVASHTDVITQGLGARSAAVASIPGGIGVTLRFADPLERVFALPIANNVDLRAVPLGMREDGTPWTMRLGPHTLVAGSSGSGKASLVWGLLLGLAPAIRSGIVEVHGIDLKSAMELGMGPQLLTRFAATPENAVQLLEDAVAAMQERARQLAGETRQHSASAASPHVVVLIDEMAALTAYQQDRELLRRANAALALLCSQGRAVGYTVFACLQDPRKETLPMRGLFTQTVGLRLRDAMETAMVLGEGMRDKGAACHRIPPTMPGVGYVVPDDGSDPIRVRAGTVTDEMIRDAARRFAAPRHIPIVIPAPPTEPSAPSRPRARRPRRTQEGETQ